MPDVAITLGIDLGGSFIKGGLVDANGRVVVRDELNTPSDTRPEPIFNAITVLADRLLAGADMDVAAVDAMGIGIPGVVDAGAGVVRACANLTGWTDLLLRERLGAEFDLPIVVENDANVAAYGEYRIAQRDDPSLTDIVMITLGTGIGGGVVSAGNILSGGSGLAGELGHIIVLPDGKKCGCGQRGCLEQYASARSLLLDAQRAMPERGITNVKEVFALAHNGHLKAIELIDKAAEYLALGCMILCRLLDPQKIIMGGGLAAAGEALLGRVRSSYAEYSWTVTLDTPAIEAAQLGNDAGLIGAAMLAQLAFVETSSSRDWI